MPAGKVFVNPTGFGVQGVPHEPRRLLQERPAVGTEKGDTGEIDQRGLPRQCHRSPVGGGLGGADGRFCEPLSHQACTECRSRRAWAMSSSTVSGAAGW